MAEVDLHITLKDHIKKLIRPNVKILLQLGEGNLLVNSQLCSNFNGIPYFEKDERWPINLQTRRPLDFVFQIVNDGRFPWPPYIKVLQFFYDWEKQPLSWKQEGWMVKVYPELVPENAIVPEYRSERPFYLPTFTPSYSLPSWESMDMYNDAIVYLAKQMNREHPYEVYDSLVNELIGQQEITSFIGGYPQWIQGDVTPMYGDLRSRLLIQVDSLDQAEIEWAHHGSLFLFYHPKKMYDFGFVLQSAY